MSGSLVFPAQPLPRPLAPCRAPILPPDLLFCQRDKPRDSARALKRASDAGFSEFTFGASPPQARVLHLAPPPVLPHAASPGSSLGAQRLPKESKLAAPGTACSARSAHEDCCRVRPSQRARVLRSLQKPLAWEGRDSSRMSLSTTSSRARGAPAIRAGHRSSGEKPIGIGRLPLSEAQAGSSSPEHSHPPACSSAGGSLVGLGFRAAPAVPRWEACASAPPISPTQPHTPAGAQSSASPGRKDWSQSSVLPSPGLGPRAVRQHRSLTAGKAKPAGVGPRPLPGLPTGDLIRLFRANVTGRRVSSAHGPAPLAAGRGQLQPEPSPPPCLVRGRRTGGVGGPQASVTAPLRGPDASCLSVPSSTLGSRWVLRGSLPPG